MAQAELAGVTDRWTRRYGVYYDESGISESRFETVRIYGNKVGWHSIESQSSDGPYGSQSVYAMFIPWQADEETRKDAWAEAEKMQQRGGFKRYVVVDPLGEGQTVL